MRSKILAFGLILLSGMGMSQNDNPGPVTRVFGDAQVVNCTDDPVRIGVIVKNWVEGMQYLWSNGETDSSILVLPSETSTYTVQVSNPDISYSSNHSIKVEVQNDPIFTEMGTFGIGKLDCPGTAIELGVNHQGGYPPFSYEWSNGSLEANPTIEVYQNQYLEVTVTDACGTTEEARINVFMTPHDPIKVAPTNTFEFDCGGDELRIYPNTSSFEGGVGHGFKYTFSSWDKANESLVVLAEDKDVYEVMVTDACENNYATSIILLDQNDIEIPELSDELVCANSEVELIEEELGYYYWDGTEMHQSYQTTIDQDQTFVIDYLDKCGNTHKLEKSYAVDVVDASFGYYLDRFSGQASFYPTVQEDVKTYTWLVDGVEISTSESPALNFGRGSTQEVTLEAENKNGCIGTTTRTIVVQDGIDIPTAFSPNGDGRNEAFSIQIQDELSEFSIKIYDRWGQLQYESRDQYFAWEGLGTKTNVPINTYTYVLEAKTMDGNIIEKAGTITEIMNRR